MVLEHGVEAHGAHQFVVDVNPTVETHVEDVRRVVAALQSRAVMVDHCKKCVLRKQHDFELSFVSMSARTCEELVLAIPSDHLRSCVRGKKI